METTKYGFFVKHNNGETMFVYGMTCGGARLLRSDGSKFPGTPGLDKLENLKKFSKVWFFNNCVYYKLKLGFVSARTGVIVSESFSRDIIRLGMRIR